VSVHGLESVPRYRELLDRLLGEELDFIPQGFILEQDDVELAYLKREILWSSQPITVAAVAAQNSFIQLLNPVGSGRIITVTRVFAQVPTFRTLNYALTTTVRGASGSWALIPTDTRWNDPITPAAALAARDAPVQTTQGNTAAGFGTDVLIGQAEPAFSGTLMELNLPVVTLAPGTGVVLSNPTVNEFLVGFFIGKSRNARPEELAR